MNELGLEETMKMAGACREFREDPVSDEILGAIFETARFAPSGGNRQPTRFVLIRDPARKRRLKELYLEVWEPYFEGVRSRQIGADVRPGTVEAADRFAHSLDRVPVLALICADPSLIQITDLDLGRPSIVGGASVYPFVQNVLLLCRKAGLGASMTSLHCPNEPEIREMIAMPDEFVLAGTLAIGWPAGKLTTKLRRRPVEELVFKEEFGIPMEVKGRA